MLKAILFDFDGVMVNSMPFHVQAWQATYLKYDVVIEPHEIYLSEGKRCQEVARELFSRRNIDISEASLNEVVSTKQASYRNITKAELYHDAKPLLLLIKSKGYLTGLVTGSPRLDVVNMLGQDGQALFDVIVTADDVKIGKPEPECYSKAAEKLKLSPDACVVIENAPLGIAAAKAAGMSIIALSTTLSPEHLTEADFWVENLGELRHNFDSILSRNPVGKSEIEHSSFDSAQDEANSYSW